LRRSTFAAACALFGASLALVGCTPDELALAQELGIDPQVVQQAQAASVPGVQQAFTVHYPEPRPTTTTTVAPPPPPPPPAPDPVPSDGELAALRDCESGGDYAAVSSGGWYRGAYQFAQSTWNGVAERNLPHLAGVDPATASPADQDAMARALWWESGWAPWPHCGSYL
jgi:hypothetical protein